MNTTRVLFLTAWSQPRSQSPLPEPGSVGVQDLRSKPLTSSINCLASVEIALDLNKAALNCDRGTARCRQFRRFGGQTKCTAQSALTKDLSPARANMLLC